MSRVQFKTNHGDFIIELNEELAPITSANFIEYVNAGHYNGTIFHRVISNFMVQADNGLKNVRGSVAMARTSDPHSASAQFFINVVDNDFLNYSSPTPQGWGYAVFGMVTEGMDVVDAIRKVPTGSAGFHQDVPKEDVVVLEASVI